MIIRPFGPAIYKNTISDEIFEFLKTLSENQKNNIIEMNYNLVGNIKEQSLLIFPDQYYNHFIDYIKYHVFAYIQDLHDINNDERLLDINSINFHLGQGVWINYQKPGEFNPVHTHSGSLSCVIYIDIPEEIEKESEENSKISMKGCPGFIELIYGSKGFLHSPQYSFLPKNKEIIIFPADLLHTVYPFKSNCERISIAFNIYNLEYRFKEE